MSAKLARTYSKKVDQSDINQSLEFKSNPTFCMEIEKDQNNIITILNRTKSVLEGYRNYAQHLEFNCKKYKQKYG